MRTCRELREAEVGAVYTFLLPDGWFGACQVVAQAWDAGSGHPSCVEVVTLDYLSPERPTAARVSQLQVLRETWAGGDGEPARHNVERRVPWWAERVAVIEPIETFTDRCFSFEGWVAVLGAYHRYRWERGARRVWKRDQSRVRVDLGGGPAELHRDLVTVIIGPDGVLRTPATGRTQFDALDALPCLTGIEYAGRDAGVLDYVISRKLPGLTWLDHGQRTIDLRASRIEELSLDAHDQPVTLHAPETLRTLTVSGDVEQVAVEGARLEFPFRLVLQGARIARPPRGLEAALAVEYCGLVDTDTSGLASYSQLAELTLRGAPGTLRDASTLACLSGLRELEIEHLYGLDVEHWPVHWPRLDGVRMRHVRKADASAIQAALAEVPEVHTTWARDDAWLDANADNPFRGWGQYEDQSFGRAACAAWDEARTEATRLGAHAKPADARNLLQGLVTALNRLDIDHGNHNIELTRRADAREAFFSLARDVGISSDQASSWFDEWREF